MTRRDGRRYGAIRWEPGLAIGDAIRAVKAFHRADDAVGFVAPACRAGERWAVVDLLTMAVVADGAAGVVDDPSHPGRPVTSAPGRAARQARRR